MVTKNWYAPCHNLSFPSIDVSVDAQGQVMEDHPVLAEPEQFEALFRKHYGAVFRAIYRIVGDRAGAEELAIDVFITLLRNSQIGNELAGGWLYRTAIRRAVYELRVRARHARYAQYAQFFGVGGPAPTPEEIQASVEEREHVRKVLAALKPRQSELLLLRGDGLSYDELAALLGLNPSSVGALLGRAQKAFRKEYTRNYGEPKKRK